MAEGPVPESPEGIAVEELRAQVMALASAAPEGEDLDPVTAALTGFAVRACAMTLDLDGARRHLLRALDVGATAEQVQETLVLIAGIGIHGLIGTAAIVADVLRQSGHEGFVGNPTPEQQLVFTRVGGSDPREQRIAAVAPDFLANLVRLTPEPVVKAIMAFRAAPWLGTALTDLQREFIGIAVDSMPTHRFMPTLRMHVQRALDLGAGRRQVEAVLAIAAAAPEHMGVR